MRKKETMTGVWVIVFLGMAALFVQTGDVGKDPRDEIVIHTQEKDLRSGELFDVEVVKCKRCGQVISWVRFNRYGIPVAGRMHSGHVCDKVLGKKGNYNGAGIIVGDFNQWLSRLQVRLSRR